MTHAEFEKEVREIAEYLGCNEDELVMEVNTLVSKMGYIFESTTTSKGE